jgi:hypothetical protein
VTEDGRAALDMLDAFTGVGASRFDLTLTDAAGRKAAFRPGCTLDELRLALPAVLGDAGRRRHNVIVRPRGPGPALIQLDDLDTAAASRVQPASFLVLNTSPGSCQAWVAVTDADLEASPERNSFRALALTAGVSVPPAQRVPSESYTGKGSPCAEPPTGCAEPARSGPHTWRRVFRLAD